MASQQIYRNNGPFYPHDFFPGVAGGHGATVPFDQKLAKSIYSLYMFSPVVSTAVNQFVTYVTRSQVKVSGKGSSSISQEQLERELLPAINQMILEFVLYGYTNVCVGKSRVAAGRPTLVVVPSMCVQQAMSWDENWQITYTVSTTAGKEGEGSNVRVLCAYPPDARGTLTSPIAQCITHLGYVEHLWTTYITGSERSVNPAYLLIQERGTSSTLPGIDRMPLTSSIITSGNLGQAPLDQLLQTAEQDATEHSEKMLEAARRQRADILAVQRKELSQIKQATSAEKAFDTETILPGALRAQLASDPLDNLYAAPPGYNVSRGPEFKTPTEFTRVIDLVAAELYRALGLPIVLLQSRADTSSNVDLAISVLNENVVQFQRRIAPLIAEALDMVFSDEIKKEEEDRALAEDVISIAGTGHEAASEQQEPIVPKLHVDFVINPITTFELVKQLFDAGLITEEAYQDVALSIFNLPSTAKRPNMKQYLKQQQESAKKPRTK